MGFGSSHCVVKHLFYKNKISNIRFHEGLEMSWAAEQLHVYLKKINYSPSHLNLGYMDVETTFPEGVKVLIYCADLWKALYFHQVASTFKYCFSSVILPSFFLPLFVVTK